MKIRIDWFKVFSVVLWIGVVATIVWDAYLSLFVYFDSVLTPREKLLAYWPTLIPMACGIAIFALFTLFDE